MQPGVKGLNKSTEQQVSMDFTKSGDHTQPVNKKNSNRLTSSHKRNSLESLKNTRNNCQDSEANLKNSNMNKSGPSSTGLTFSPLNVENLSEDEYYVRLLNDFQPKDPTKTNEVETGDPSKTNVSKVNTLTTDKKNQNSNNKTQNKKGQQVNKVSTKTGNNLSVLGEVNKKFVNLCQMLNQDLSDNTRKDKEFDISKILLSKDFGRDLNLCQSKNSNQTSLLDDLREPTEIDNIAQYIAKKRAPKVKVQYANPKSRRSKRKLADIEVDSDSSSTILSTCSNSKDDNVEESRHGGREKSFGRTLKPSKRTRNVQDDIEHMDARSNLATHSTDNDSKPTANKQDSPKTSKHPEWVGKNEDGLLEGSEKNDLEVRDEDKREGGAATGVNGLYRSIVNLDMDRSNFSKRNGPTKMDKVKLSTSVLDLDVLENLDKLGGVKYEPGSVDLRRKYKSFERLCFGLGCTVPPTKQELEMCSQLSIWGDDSSLSQYETSVYQSCLLRSRSFESIWKKFCNKVIAIIRRYTLQGVKRLMKIIYEQKLVEPFLKVILIDIGTDRQDQQLFISITQEEMDQILDNKYILLKLNVKNHNSVDDMVNQMYIQMYQLLLLNSASYKGTSGNKPSTGRNTRYRDPREYQQSRGKFERSWNEKGSQEENFLDALVKLYDTHFSGKELILIIDKVNPMINDILYMFQMIKRRKLMLINSVLLVCSNCQYLERYCTSLIYSNLGIFQCNMFIVSCIADEVIQLLLYDIKVQEFIPNFKMVMEIYEMFSSQDSSLTLMILRVYQLYEQYYNRYIFSYLSIVPSFVFDSPYPSEEDGDTFVSSGRDRERSGKEGMDNEISVNMEDESELKRAKEKSEENRTDKEGLGELMLPPESLVKEGVGVDADVTKLSDISTTTSLNSSLLFGKMGSPQEGVSPSTPLVTTSEGSMEVNFVNKETGVSGMRRDVDRVAGTEEDRSHSDSITTIEEESGRVEDEVSTDDYTDNLSHSGKVRLTRSGTKTPLHRVDKSPSTGLTSNFVTKTLGITIAKRSYSPSSGGANLIGSDISSNANSGRNSSRASKKSGNKNSGAVTPNNKTTGSTDLESTTIVYTVVNNNTNDTSTRCGDGNTGTNNTNVHVDEKRTLYNLSSSITNIESQRTNIEEEQRYKSTEESICVSEVASVGGGDSVGLNGEMEEKENVEIKYEHFGDMNRKRMLERAKRLYSIYSLLSISNNMSDNYVAYLELKLVVELDLQKVILELLPLNTMILLQRRLLFQLGVNLLYRLLVFLPDSYPVRSRITHLLSVMPMFTPTGAKERVEEMERPAKELIRRVLKYLSKKCSCNLSKDDKMDELKTIIIDFNKEYKSVIQTAMDIQTLLDGGRDTYETESMLREMSRIIDENMELPRIVKEIRHKLHLCLFPFINTFQLSSILMLQSYNTTFSGNLHAVSSPPTPATANGLGVPSLIVRTISGHALAMDPGHEKLNEGDIILYIYKYIRYRVINMWKLFIIYYYIATSKQTNPQRERGLVEIYIKFNINIELLEKIYKIILITQSTSAAITSKEASKNILDKKLTDSDMQVCYLIKSSLSNINVKFL